MVSRWDVKRQEKDSISHSGRGYALLPEMFFWKTFSENSAFWLISCWCLSSVAYIIPHCLFVVLQIFDSTFSSIITGSVNKEWPV